MVAGAAAGIAAAFNTPLGGIVFALEQLSCRRSMSHSAPVVSSIVLAGLVAAISVATDGATVGAGYAPTRALLDGQAELPGVYTLLKFCASWLSAWTGVPAGMFAPSLAIGAGIGHDVARLVGVGREAAIPLIALGMVGFLAAMTKGPITAFITVMEMVSGHAMVLSLVACALLASGVARLLTTPMYLELAALLSLSPEIGSATVCSSISQRRSAGLGRDRD